MRRGRVGLPRGSVVLDETYVKAAERWICLYRAANQYMQAIDVLVANGNRREHVPVSLKLPSTAVTNRGEH
jgi:transposase-like protein